VLIAVYRVLAICVVTVMGISSVSAADDICRTKKLSETRSSVRNIVNEVSLPTVHAYSLSTPLSRRILDS